MTKIAKPKLRDSVRTRAAILAAAQEAFSARGYNGTGIRDIAAIAGVSSSLIDRYFGSKGNLFEEALLDAMREGKLFEEGRKNFGERLSKRLAEPDVDLQLLSMSVLSAADDEAREITSRITAEFIIEPTAKWLGPPNARARAMQLIMISTGFVIYTRQLPIGVGKSNLELSRKWLAEVLQEIVDRSE